MATVWGRFEAAIETKKFPWMVLGAVGGLGIVSSLLMMLGTWLEYQKSPPPCDGIGFGCSPGPAFMGLLVAFMWGAGLGSVAVLLGLTEPFWERLKTLRAVIALVALAAAIILTLLIGGSAISSAG